jgi:7-carboxy-7-deazaguanine synthase
LVLTGGEPMLFAGVADLAALARAAGRMVTIETAGTCLLDVPCDLMSISPKLANSTPADARWGIRHEAARLNIPVLSALLKRYDAQLKFVVGAETDVSEIEALLSQLPPVAPNRILLMAEGVDRDELRRKTRALVPIAMARNWRLTTRLHIDLFGDTKGT